MWSEDNGRVGRFPNSQLPLRANGIDLGVPIHNVARSQIVETIILVNGEKRLGPMRWGFVTSTAKEPKLAPINARADPSPRARLDGPALETAKRHPWNSDASQLFVAYERVSKRFA